jgi:hypothetical protein
MGALGAEVESEEAVLDPRLDDAAPASLPTADCRLPTADCRIRVAGTPLVVATPGGTRDRQHAEPPRRALKLSIRYRRVMLALAPVMG